MTTAAERLWRRHPERISIGLLLLLHLLVLLARVAPILAHPGEYLLAPAGDGIKTYYALLYYVLYDHGLTFSGMNYPHGELLLYTDGFPLLAWALKAWNTVFGLAPGSIIAVLNVTILLSSLPATPLVYVMVRRAGVGRLWAGASALAIVLLSPQFHRLAGHLTLALPFVVPLLWYLQVRLSEEVVGRRARWLSIYVGTALAMALVHPYYLLHALLLPTATALVQAVQQWRHERKWWQLPLWLMAAGVAPVTLFRVFMSLIDPVVDRPINPYGFLVYHANAASVFGPIIEPFASVFQFIFRTDAPVMEGYAYVGLPVLLALALGLARALGYLIQRRPGLVLRPVLPTSTLRATVWAVGPILLFSMAWPFVFGTMSQILEWLPGLKQFRALGRFAWIFYYVMAVWAAVQYWLLYRYLRQRRAARFGRLLLGAVLAVWFLEAKHQLEYITRPLKEHRVAEAFIGPGQSYRDVLLSAGYDPAAYQALIPLPFYAIGSEKFDIGGSSTSIYEGFRASLNLNLPLVSVMLSRSSIGHTLPLVQIFSSDLTPKSWLRYLPSRRPLLVLASRLDSLRPAERHLLRSARLLAQTAQVRMYELPLSAFVTARPAQEIAAFATHRAQLIAQGPLWRSTAGAGIVWNTFNKNSSPSRPFFTQPGIAATDKGAVTVFDGILPNPLAVDTATYEASIWAYAKGNDWLPVFGYRQFDANGTIVEEENRSLKESTEISGDWVRYSTIIHLRNPANRVVIEVSGNDVMVDDLLIRPRSTPRVYWLDAENQPVLNGFPLVAVMPIL